MSNALPGPPFARTLIRRADAIATTLAVTLLAAIGLAATAPEADARTLSATASAKAQTTTGGGAVAGTPLSKLTAPGAKATITSTGLAIPPADAPAKVQAAIRAGNKIAKTPYKWGGGHGRLVDSGYDCSGSVSFALRNAKLMTSSMVSGAFAAWGQRGRGDWITIRANAGHVYMIIAGLRFDTSASKQTGTRWSAQMRSARGFVATHPPGL
jgi:hypothetical protein